MKKDTLELKLRSLVVTELEKRSIFPLYAAYNIFIPPDQDALVKKFHGYFAGVEGETIKYPTTWWDAFRNRFFPNLLINKYPIQFTEKTIFFCCPHVKWIDDTKEHTTWLINVKEQK